MTMTIEAFETGGEAAANFYNDIDIGFCIIKVDFDARNRRADYRFIEVNTAFEEHTGLQDATGRWMRNLVPDHEQFWFDRYAEIARTGRPARFEYTAQALGNRHFEVYAYRVGAPEQQRVAILFADISARKREEALRAALFALTDQLAEHDDDPASLTDVVCGVLGQTLGAQLVGYGLVDAVAETITVERDWTTGGVPSLAGTVNFRDFGSYIEDLKRGETVVVTDARTDPRTQAFAPALEVRGARAFVNTPIFERGRFVALQYVSSGLPRSWTEDELQFIREVAARLRTATERRRAEQALKHLNSSLAREVADRTVERDRLWATTTDLMATASYDGFLKGLNPAWTQLLGWSEAELLEKPFETLIHPEDFGSVVAVLRRVQAGETVRDFTDRVLTKDGGTRMITWAVTPDVDPASGVFHVTGRDVTALRAAEEQLRQSQKLEAVGQLTGGVAHDFNNLLTIIRSSVDFLRRPELPEARKSRYLDAVSETVDRAAKLTGQLLAFARRQALKPEVFDAGAKLRGVGDMLDTVTGARVRVVVVAPDHSCFIRADVSQFETALVNMAVNARDAMDGEGRLTLRLECSKPMPAIRGHAASRSDFTAVSVTDTGSGIAPDRLGRIFEPFFTTKEVGKGTGLGLSQVFGFAKQSGGDVDVRSVVGEGTTFTLYLPEEIAPTRTAVFEAEAQLAPVGGGQRVLVVEDNIEVGRFCTQSLEDLGYRTEWAANAEEALDKLGADGDGFDAVFSDVVMPGMGGVALAATLRRQLPGLPVVLASGYSHVLAQEVDHGFELLHKPYSADQLARVLQRVMTKALSPQACTASR